MANKNYETFMEKEEFERYIEHYFKQGMDGEIAKEECLKDLFIIFENKQKGDLEKIEELSDMINNEIENNNLERAFYWLGKLTYEIKKSRRNILHEQQRTIYYNSKDSK